MFSHLISFVLILGGLVGLAFFNDPAPSNPCCQNHIHNDPGFGEVGYCPIRDR